MGDLNTLREFPDILVNHEEILWDCPDYHKITQYLEGIRFYSKEEMNDFVQENYQDSVLYSDLSSCGYSESRKRKFIFDNANSKYDALVPVLKEAISNSVQLCELIEYIGFYPAVLEKDGKVPEFEKIMQELEIVPRVYVNHGTVKFLIASSDISRIVGTLRFNLEFIKRGVTLLSGESDWIFRKNRSLDQLVSEFDELKEMLMIPESSETESEIINQRKKYFK